MQFMNPVLSQFPLTRWPLIMAGFSLAMLLGAWGFEYIGKYLPCALCYDQRYIHMAVIGLGLLGGSVAVAAKQARASAVGSGLTRSWSVLASVLPAWSVTGVVLTRGARRWRF